MSILLLLMGSDQLV